MRRRTPCSRRFGAPRVRTTTRAAAAAESPIRPRTLGGAENPTKHRAARLGAGSALADCVPSFTVTSISDHTPEKGHASARKLCRAVTRAGQMAVDEAAPVHQWRIEAVAGDCV